MAESKNKFKIKGDTSTIDNRRKPWKDNFQLFRGYDRTIRFLNGFSNDIVDFSNTQ